MGKLWEPDSRYFKPKLSYSKKRFSPPKLNGNKINKILVQVVVSLMIFVLVWGIFQFNGNFALTMQKSIRTWFSQDTDIISVFKKIGDATILGDPVEKVFFDLSNMPVINEPPDELTIPVSGTLVQKYGWQESNGKASVFNNGITISASINTGIKAADGGVVTNIGYQPDELGRFIEITHANGYTSLYGHCNEILVSINQLVQKGQYIAKVGKTGKAPYSQLYFQYSNKGEAINPMDLLGLKDEM